MKGERERIASHLEQLHRYEGCPGSLTWPQPSQRNHSPSALTFINLKVSPSTQYGHRMGFDMLSNRGLRFTCPEAFFFFFQKPADFSGDRENLFGILLNVSEFAEFPPEFFVVAFHGLAPSQAKLL